MIPVRPSLDPARFQREPWRDVDAARGMARPPVRRPARQDRQWVSLRCGSVSIGFNGRCEFAIARKAGPASAKPRRRQEPLAVSPARAPQCSAQGSQLPKVQTWPSEGLAQKIDRRRRVLVLQRRNHGRGRLLGDGGSSRTGVMVGRCGGRTCADRAEAGSRQNPLAPATILADLARVLIPDVGTLHRSRRPLPGTGAAGRGYLGVSIPRRLP